MNRRAMIRKAVGAGAAVAALPVLQKALEANDRVYTGANSDCTALPSPVGEWQPPPPDLRTPEQVIADQDAEMVQDVLRHLTNEPYAGARRYAYSVWPAEYNGAIAALRTQGVAFTEGQVNGIDYLVGPNGNVVRKLAQVLHFA